LFEDSRQYPAEVADRLMVVQRESERDASAQSAVSQPRR
jgi:hypothetical protein